MCAVEVGGRVVPSGVLVSRLSTLDSRVSVHHEFFYLSSSHVRLSVRPSARPSSSCRTKRGPECKVEKTVADKVVLFEQKRPGLVMFLRGRNRAEKRQGRARARASTSLRSRYRLHEYYSNERDDVGESRGLFCDESKSGLHRQLQLFSRSLEKRRAKVTLL